MLSQVVPAGLVIMMTCLLGCASPEPGNGPGGAVQLEVEPEEVGAGDEVVITLVNRSSSDLGYNLCPAVLERREGEDWTERPERPAEICTMELRILAPDASATYRHRIPSGLPDGEYRFRTGVELPLGEGRVEVASHPFRVG